MTEPATPSESPATDGPIAEVAYAFTLQATASGGLRAGLKREPDDATIAMFESPLDTLVLTLFRMVNQPSESFLQEVSNTQEMINTMLAVVTHPDSDEAARAEAMEAFRAQVGITIGTAQ